MREILLSATPNLRTIDMEGMLHLRILSWLRGSASMVQIFCSVLLIHALSSSVNMQALITLPEIFILVPFLGPSHFWLPLESCCPCTALVHFLEDWRESHYSNIWHSFCTTNYSLMESNFRFWLQQTKQRPGVYVPQLGDDIVYLREAHEQYLDSIPRDAHPPSLNVQTLQVQESCHESCHTGVHVDWVFPYRNAARASCWMGNKSADSAENLTFLELNCSSIISQFEVYQLIISCQIEGAGMTHFSCGLMHPFEIGLVVVDRNWHHACSLLSTWDGLELRSGVRKFSIYEPWTKLVFNSSEALVLTDDQCDEISLLLFVRLMRSLQPCIQCNPAQLQACSTTLAHMHSVSPLQKLNWPEVQL